MDVGTSSVRAVAFDSRGDPLHDTETKIEYAPRIAADGTAEVAYDRLERIAHEAVDRTLQAAGRAPIEAVGLSTFWHGLLGVDRRGEPTTPVLLWSDSRSWRQAERLRAELDAEAVRARTGCPIHPSYWPAKLAWLREAEPERWTATTHWLGFADLLYRRLLGALWTSASMASGTGLRRLDGGWDGELLDRLGVAEGRLPPEAVEMRGLAAGMSRRWPQLADARWLTAAGDGALANLGSGCVDPSERALTVGTSGALRVMTDRRPPALAPGLWCYLLEPGRYVIGGSLSNGGNLYAWLVRTLRLDEDGLEERLRDMPPDGTGLTFLPLLAGERSPGFAAHATGAVAGLTQATRPHDLARAGLEAVALTFAGVDQALDRTVPGAARLVASGHALLSSPVWVQMMADAIGKPVVVSRSAMEASSQGAALLALRRLGVHPGRRERSGRNVEPREAAHVVYRGALERQRRLYAALIESQRD